ncbi:hypothetical protein BZA77DRAFT_312249 [Pyronema omphalodes]|nr:hypothetical protein BZA77DRAFT_312249 [Pyronema omphalodes]
MDLRDFETSSSESEDNNIGQVSDSAPNNEADEQEYQDIESQVAARIAEIESFDPEFYAQLGDDSYELESTGMRENETITISDNESEQESNAGSDSDLEENAAADITGPDIEAEVDGTVGLASSTIRLRSTRSALSTPIAMPCTTDVSRVYPGPTTNAPQKAQGTVKASSSSAHSAASSSVSKVSKSSAISRVKQLELRDGSPQQSTPSSPMQKEAHKTALPEKATSTVSISAKKTNQKTAAPGKANLPANKAAEHPKRTRTADSEKDTLTEYDTDSEIHDPKRKKALSGHKVSSLRDLDSPATRSITRSMTSPTKEVSKQAVVNSPAPQRPTRSSTMPKKITAQATPKGTQAKRKRAVSEEKGSFTQPGSQKKVVTPVSSRVAASTAVAKNTPTQLEDSSASTRHYTRASAATTSKEISTRKGVNTGASTPLSRISNGEVAANDAAPQVKKTPKRSKRSRLGATTKRQLLQSRARHAAAALRAAENPRPTKRSRPSIGYVYVSSDEKKLTVEEMFARTAKEAEKSVLGTSKEFQASTKSGDNLDSGKTAAEEQQAIESDEEMDSELSEISMDA